MAIESINTEYDRNVEEYSFYHHKVKPKHLFLGISFSLSSCPK